MKISTAVILSLPLAAGAFAPCSKPAFTSSTRLSMAVITGPKGKPAVSAEEDLMLTLKLIMDHEDRSATVSKEQYISQVEEAAEAEEEVVEEIDISIPYDAAAKLAYEASDKSMDYADFKVKYEADSVAHVISKQPVDISIPYDAAAKLAYEASDKSMAYADFKVKYEADSVAHVISKQPVDISIPYDAAAKLAYEASDKSMAYADFKEKFEADAVAAVIAKQPKAEKEEAAEPAASDISIPYDAAAKNAYDASDKSMGFDEFKTSYEAKSVEEVIAKQPVDISIPYDAAAILAFEASDRSMPFADFKAKFEADAVAAVIAKKSS